MAQFSEQEQNAMRRDAARRAQEMQRRVHPTASPGRRLPSQFADYQPETSAPEPEPTPKPQPPKLPLLGNLPVQSRRTFVQSGWRHHADPCHDGDAL